MVSPPTGFGSLPSVTTAPALTIRLATAADAGAIAEIYNREVTETTATFDLVPRTVEAQRAWLADRSGAFAAIVGVDVATREIVAFASLSPYKQRAAYSTTVENSIYVRRDVAGRGVGQADDGASDRRGS